MFFRGSRYADVAEHEITDDKGRVIRYKRLREIPAPPSSIRSHVVRQRDRLDMLAHDYYRNPERFWRICDANRATWPDDLLDEPGRSLAIPPAED